MALKSPWLRVPLFLISVLAVLEVLAGAIFSIMPFEPHQRYGRVGNPLKRHNGNSAQGDFDMGQKLRVAVFGSSMTGLPNLSTDETWPQYLKRKWGEDKVHIDNFATGWAKPGTISLQLQGLKKLGQKYDLVIVSLLVSESNRGSLSDLYELQYSSRWLVDGNHTFAFPVLLKRWWERRLSIERWDQYLPRAEALPLEDVNNHTLRQSEEVKKRLVSRKYTMNRNKKAAIQEQIDSMIPNLSQVTQRVLWVPERPAYHPQMKPSVEERYVLLSVADGATPENPLYEDAQTLNMKLNQRADATMEAIRSRNIPTADPWQAMRDRLPTEDDLFVDEFHLSAKGGDTFSSLILETVKKEFPELF